EGNCRPADDEEHVPVAVLAGGERADAARAPVDRPVASPALRRIPLLLSLAFVLTGSSAAQTQVGFLAMGDYGVGGSREQALGLGMRRFEARHPADMLVTLGDNDYLGSPARFRVNWQKAFGWARRSGLKVGGVLG